MSSRNLMVGSLLAAALMLGLVAAAPAGEGKLERIRDEVRDRDGPGRDRGRHDDDEDDGEDEGFIAEVFIEPALEFGLEVALWALASPFWGPVAILHDRPGFPGRPYRFERYPYADGAEGHLRPAVRSRRRPRARPEVAPGIAPTDRPEEGTTDAPAVALEGRPRERWAPLEGRELSATGLFSYERHSDGIGGLRGELQLRTRSRFNLDLSATDYAEDVDGEVEHMGHFKGHATYSFAVSRHAVFSAGLGTRVLSWEGGQSRGGLDFRYEAEFFPARPLHLHAIAEAGWVGDEAAWELEGRVGLLLKRAEVFVGYRHFSVAGEKLAGPTVGLGVWF